MAKYLDTAQISSELMQLIKEAKERIILVTYSLQVNSQIQERLKTKSKLGTLAEITVIYGNTIPKKTELEWMSEVDDLKVWQKKNLHAKCYINENKAIISSMNLYDYSQTTNIEMGFLITKEENPEAYAAMMEDIDDLRINGDRVKPWLENDIQKEEAEEKVILERKEKIDSSLSYTQQIKQQLLESFRTGKSIHFRQNSKSILSDNEILEIISKNHLTTAHLNQVLKSKKKVNQIGDEIIQLLKDVGDLVVGEILETNYQNDEFSYDQIKMKRLDNGSSMWYDTKKELPKKRQIVAVSLNGNWFNDYLLLEKTDSKDELSISTPKNYSNSSYKSTKELSEITGISSREINSILTSLGLMEKKGTDWFSTHKGEKMGGVQKEGQYGKFILWPEEIIHELELA